jgi:heme/copper-type cytochrome/quinol oxidase subunit 2
MRPSNRGNLLAVALLVSCAIPMQDHAQERPPDRRVEIVGERFSYTPSRIRVRAGTTVEFVLTSEDTYHGFFMADFNVNLMIPPLGKGEATVRVTFTQPGEYVFECSRPCGAGHNAMRGVVIVEE